MSLLYPRNIETYTGQDFDYTNPVVNVEDVAHALSQVCRFGGHTTRFYSVAEHSILVSLLVSRVERKLALAALWHDAHEAYLGDMPSPLKAIIGPEYKALASGIDRAIKDYLGIEDDLRDPLIKMSDEVAAVFEASRLKTGVGWEFSRHMRHERAEEVCHWLLGWSPAQAAYQFQSLHKELT